ncbi:G-protein coupled receptor 182 [Dissostichus eleginoides]|uniref:G-protein coupled receptor 182 n=1 Tax=Dissostichus eleginoides TaxID=100907 RepID=A0AAD9FH76_DISEL|nr:G-protein coupled receptor 182 [Dissostichus eleginoides]
MSAHEHNATLDLYNNSLGSSTAPSPGFCRRLPAHRPLPHLPFHLHGGPAGERAGHLGQLAPTPLGQRGPVLHPQREPVTHLVYTVNFYSSSFFLALMTAERYLSLTRPSFPAFFPVLGRRRWVLCGGLWVLSLFLALLENVHVDLLEWDEPGCYMLPKHNFTEWFVSVGFLCLVFQFLGPAAVIITCNVLIARAVRTAPDAQGRRDVWLVHIYSLVFVLCWLPYNFVMFLMIVDDIDPFIFSCNTMEVLYFSFSVVQSLSLFHCVANPILYNFLSKSFRDNLVNTVLSQLPRDGAGNQLGAGTNAPNGGGGDPGKQRKLSNASTSQSDVGS